MEQKVTITLVDDLDGSEGAETVSFGLDGTNYEIDLSEKNAAALLDHVTISDNRARAEAASGGAVIDGVGLTSEGVLRISDSVISGNSGEAVGTTSSARGGGIFNALVFESAAPKLTLQNTRVTGNSLTANSTQGGGIYTAFPISLLGSVVTHNAPDDCSGC